MVVYAATVLAKAVKYLGVKENPANSNNVIFNTRYYNMPVCGPKYPWCMAFQWCLFDDVNASELFYGGKRTASCSALVSYAKAHGQWVTSGYKPGMLAIFDFELDGDLDTDHVGIIESVNTDGTITTIDGNTGTTNEANGGEVMRRTRSLKYVIGAYAPAYKEEDELATYIERIATAAGVSTDEVVNRLALVVKFQDTVTDDYQKAGIAALKEKGLISVDRDPRSQVNWGDFGTVLSRNK